MNSIENSTHKEREERRETAAPTLPSPRFPRGQEPILSTGSTAAEAIPPYPSLVEARVEGARGDGRRYSNHPHRQKRTGLTGEGLSLG